MTQINHDDLKPDILKCKVKWALVKEETERIGSILKAGLHLGLDCGLSYMPSICGNDIPTGKPDTPDGRAPGYLDSPSPKRIP